MRTVYRTLTKLKWMVFNAVASELPFAMAVSGLLCELRLAKQFDHFRIEDGVEWTSSHTQLADMGGFVVVFAPGTASSAWQMNKVPSDQKVSCVGGGSCRGV